jgi:hypothetical protein
MLPAAQQLSAGVLTRLIKAHLKHGSIDRASDADDEEHVRTCAVQLFGLPAAQDLSAGMVAHLLKTAIEQGDGAVALHLFRLPAAQQLSAEMVEELLQAAVLAEQSGEALTTLHAWRLYTLPAAQQLSAAALSALLAAAIRPGQGMASHITYLCDLPAAQQVSTREAQELLQAAEQCWGMSCKQQAQMEHIPWHRAPWSLDFSGPREAYSAGAGLDALAAIRKLVAKGKGVTYH